MTILKEFRINNELGQKEMADKLKCSCPAYRNYENGKRVMPNEILLNFLKLRNWEEDQDLIKVLGEIIEYGKK